MKKIWEFSSRFADRTFEIAMLLIVESAEELDSQILSRPKSVNYGYSALLLRRRVGFLASGFLDGNHVTDLPVHSDSISSSAMTAQKPSYWIGSFIILGDHLTEKIQLI